MSPERPPLPPPPLPQAATPSVSAADAAKAVHSFSFVAIGLLLCRFVGRETAAGSLPLRGGSLPAGRRDLVTSVWCCCENDVIGRRLPAFGRVVRPRERTCSRSRCAYG